MSYLEDYLEEQRHQKGWSENDLYRLFQSFFNEKIEDPNSGIMDLAHEAINESTTISLLKNGLNELEDQINSKSDFIEESEDLGNATDRNMIRIYESIGILDLFRNRMMEQRSISSNDQLARVLIGLNMVTSKNVKSIAGTINKLQKGEIDKKGDEIAPILRNLKLLK